MYNIYEHITAKTYGYLEMNTLTTYNIELRLDGEKQKLRELHHIREVLSTASNLEELSLRVNRYSISLKAV